MSIFKKAVERWGERAQLLKTLEECNELSTAIARYLNRPSADKVDNIAEEAVDVLIMLSQLLEMTYPEADFDDLFKKWIDVKFGSLEQKLGKK